MTTTHLFPSTGAAYDACQCDDRVATGDVLLVESEQVAGVAHTWPFAVTQEPGKLHQLRPGCSAAQVDPRCGVGAVEAARVATARGWPLLACTWCTCPLGLCRQRTDQRCKNSRSAAPRTEEEDLAVMEGQAAEDAKGGLDFSGQPEPTEVNASFVVDVDRVLARERGRTAISHLQRELRDLGWKRLGNLVDFEHDLAAAGYRFERDMRGEATLRTFVLRRPS